MNCPRCGICHKDAEEANKNGGGVGHIYQWDSGKCPVCRDLQHEH